jgi:hypothetical protein
VWKNKEVRIKDYGSHKNSEKIAYFVIFAAWFDFHHGGRNMALGKRK